MTANGNNIYKNARTKAGITVEYAAECLNVCPRTLYKYESGELIPDTGTVTQMAIAYGTPYLRMQHLNSVNAQWGDLIPAIEEQNVAASTVAFLNKLNKANEQKNKLLELAGDGINSEADRADWDGIVSTICELIKAGYELQFSRQKKGDQKNA